MKVVMEQLRSERLSCAGQSLLVGIDDVALCRKIENNNARTLSLVLSSAIKSKNRCNG
jgi:hypothetical protein